MNQTKHERILTSLTGDSLSSLFQPAVEAGIDQPTDEKLDLFSPIYLKI